jgi:hypothetical protein
MNIIDAINRWDKRYAWSLLGFVLAVIFGAVSLYTEFVRDRRPQLRFELISDASVLDVREQLGNLEIIYDGRDIKKAKQSLRVVVIRITNTGADDILIGSYDQRSPLGFRVSSGNLLRTEILSTSNAYLGQTLRIDQTAPDTALFAPVIIESNEWFTVKSLMLHSDGSLPTFQPVGKIAGVRDIRLVDSTQAGADPSFLTTAFSGGAWVQAARLLAYFFGFILLLFAVIAPTTAISSILAKRARRKRVMEFKSLTKRVLTEKDEYIFERYIENDFGHLRLLQRTASRPNLLNRSVKQYQRRRREPVQVALERELLLRSTTLPHHRVFRSDYFPVEDMMNSGFIIERDGRWNVEPELSATLNEFMQFLRIKGVDHQAEQNRTLNEQVPHEQRKTKQNAAAGVHKDARG